MATRHRLCVPERVRETIRTTQITKRLTNHVLGRIEMSATQVTAALGLLRKTLPDLSAIEHKSAANQNARDFTTDELDQRIRALEGKASPPPSEPIAPELH